MVKSGIQNATYMNPHCSYKNNKTPLGGQCNYIDVLVLGPFFNHNIQTHIHKIVHCSKFTLWYAILKKQKIFYF